MFIKEAHLSIDFLSSTDEGQQLVAQVKQLTEESLSRTGIPDAKPRTVTIGQRTLFGFIAFKEVEFKIYGDLVTLEATYFEDEISILSRVGRCRIEFDLDTFEVYSSSPDKRQSAMCIINELIKSQLDHTSRGCKPRDFKISEDMNIVGFLYAEKVMFSDRGDTIHVALDYVREV